MRTSICGIGLLAASLSTVSRSEYSDPGTLPITCPDVGSHTALGTSIIMESFVLSSGVGEARLMVDFRLAL